MTTQTPNKPFKGKVKPFSELKTEAAKKRRLEAYEKFYAEKGLSQGLMQVGIAGVVEPVRDAEKAALGDKIITFKMVQSQNGQKTWYTVRKYIPGDKKEMLDVLSSWKPGQLVSVVYKEAKPAYKQKNGKEINAVLNAYDMIARQKKA